jgi:hypothetical protein
MNNKALAALAATLFAVASPNAYALLYQDWSSVAINFQDTGTPQPLNILRFNPALGVLRSVEMTLNASGYAAYLYTDISGNTNSFRFTSTISVGITGAPENLGLAVGTTVNDVPRSVAASQSYMTPGFPNPKSSGISGSGSDVAAFSGPALTPPLAAFFTGLGNAVLTANGSITFNLNGTGNASNAVIGGYEGTLTGRYGYESLAEIPELDGWAGTGSLALLAGVLALIRERRAGRA